MEEHKLELEFYYLKSLMDTISCHALESNRVKLDNLFDKRKREVFKRHLNESFLSQAKESFSKKEQLHHHSQMHEELLNEVINQTNNYLEEKQGNTSQIELFKTICDVINR
jgi:hypothetical protein